MRFTIADTVYRVRFTDRKLYGPDGREASGVINYDRRVVFLSESCPPHELARTLLHELWHGWVYHCPNPTDMRGEDGAEYFSTVAQTVYRQLESQGGLAALMSLGTASREGGGLFEVARITSVLAASDRRIPCGDCGQLIAPGAVVVEAVRQKMGAPTVDLAVYCGNCECVWHWEEILTAGGVPSQTMVGEVFAHRDSDVVAAFCAAHPDQTRYSPA